MDRRQATRAWDLSWRYVPSRGAARDDRMTQRDCGDDRELPGRILRPGELPLIGAAACRRAPGARRRRIRGTTADARSHGARPLRCRAARTRASRGGPEPPDFASRTPGRVELRGAPPGATPEARAGELARCPAVCSRWPPSPPRAKQSGRLHILPVAVCARITRPGHWCPVSEVRHHISRRGIRLAALLLPQMFPVFSLVAPSHPGAAPGALPTNL